MARGLIEIMKLSFPYVGYVTFFPTHDQASSTHSVNGIANLDDFGHADGNDAFYRLICPLPRAPRVRLWAGPFNEIIAWTTSIRTDHISHFLNRSVSSPRIVC
jgi:hypothetical protein